MDDNFESFTAELSQALTRYWQSFVHALPRLAVAVVLLLLVYFLAGYISRLLGRRLSGDAHDQLFSSFIVKLVRITLLIVGVILFLHVLGFSGIAGGLLASAGISAFIFGFAFKDIAENFLAGIILAFDRPFNIEDTVHIEDHTGHVKALNFRTTHIKTFDEKDVFIPNAKVIKETLINLTRDGMIRLDFVVGIAFEDDIDSAAELIRKTVMQIPEILDEKEPFVVAEELATSTVNLRVFFWMDTDDYKKGVLLAKSKVISRVKEALVDEGFTLPADIQELKLYDKRDAFPVKIQSAPEGKVVDGLPKQDGSPKAR